MMLKIYANKIIWTFVLSLIRFIWCFPPFWFSGSLADTQTGSDCGEDTSNVRPGSEQSGALSWSAALLLRHALPQICRPRLLLLLRPDQPHQGLWHHVLLHGPFPQGWTLLFSTKPWRLLRDLHLEVCCRLYCQLTKSDVQDSLGKGTFNQDIELVLCGWTKLPSFCSPDIQGLGQLEICSESYCNISSSRSAPSCRIFHFWKNPRKTFTTYPWPFSQLEMDFC